MVVSSFDIYLYIFVTILGFGVKVFKGDFTKICANKERNLIMSFIL